MRIHWKEKKKKGKCPRHAEQSFAYKSAMEGGPLLLLLLLLLFLAAAVDAASPIVRVFPTTSDVQMQCIASHRIARIYSLS
jgi:hypothetical protein